MDDQVFCACRPGELALTLVHQDRPAGLQGGNRLVRVGERAADALGDLLAGGRRVLKQKDMGLRFQGRETSSLMIPMIFLLLSMMATEIVLICRMNTARSVRPVNNVVNFLLTW